MNAPTLVGLMLLNSAGAFCVGLGAARVLFRTSAVAKASASAPAGLLLTADEVVGDVELGLARDDRDLAAALADLSAKRDGSEDLRDRVARLQEAVRLSEERLDRDRGRLTRLAENVPSVGRDLADGLGKHRDRVGEFSDRLQGDLAEETASLTAMLAELTESNRRLQSELHETRAKLESREVELVRAQREARVDPLTKLANRRSFEERLAQCQARLERGHEPFSVVVFDLDRFKSLNDRYGHPAGDAALTVFAKILQETVRNYDLPARFGGEEFVALLPGTDVAGALIVADRCRARAEKAVVRYGSDQIMFTVSGGVAAGRPDRKQADTLARADEALYAAKSGGRNRIITEDALSSGEIGAHPAA